MTQLDELAGFNATQFSSQIDALSQLLLEFQALLHSESDFLKQNDIDKLVEIVEQKSLLSQKIQSLSDTIEKQFSQLSPNVSLYKLAQDKAFNNISKTLQEKVDNALTLSQACSDLNISNGMSIQILSNINQVSINLLTQQPESDVNLYDSSGESKQSKNRSSLGKA
ncbi:flagellar protein FlgN [Thiomicrorhabdus sp. ZW0627]|uniref:flagellar protein FlgN n=1 Tax=Thiomicrorhabdus sp. ZW0627 TaxID=3039774 RepID=UPI0024367599|nr:flagellar protein FlgN [Thiomicrorhabdus sp. ZW0627]MDG6773383.1 flagellar protein FlgN [Thiomicrorhabdus sp. ZW0627]